jgi:hypothetical protein
LPHWNARGEQEFHRAVIIRNGDGKKLDSKLKTALDEAAFPWWTSAVGLPVSGVLSGRLSGAFGIGEVSELGWSRSDLVSMALLSPL